MIGRKEYSTVEFARDGVTVGLFYNELNMPLKLVIYYVQGVVLKLLVMGVQVKWTAKNNYWELDVHIDMVYILDLSLYYYVITFT